MTHDPFEGLGPFVGASECARIFDVETPIITRWNKAGKMPPMAAWLRSTPVWHTDDVLRLRDTGKNEVPERPVALMGTAEVADKFGVNKSQVGRWRRGGKFIEPAARLTAGPVWFTGNVEAEARRREQAKAAADTRRRETKTASEPRRRASKSS